MDNFISRRALVGGVALALAAESVRLPRKIRLAIAGVEGHADEITKPLDRLPDVEVAGIADADAGALDALRKGNARLAGARVYSDYRRMLDAEKPDLVAVCNNNGERASVIIECAERGIDVIAEKPLAISRPDLERVRQTLIRKQVKLGMLLPMRFEPPYQALKRIAESGELGEVIQISAQKSYKLGNREDWYKQQKTYGSTILWIGIHMFDLMRWTSGREFTEVSSFMGRAGFSGYGDMETTTVTALRLDNGGTGSLHMDYCRPETVPTHGDDRLRLAGTKGVAEYQAATGVTLLTSRSNPVVVRELPPAGSVFLEFLQHAYNGKSTSLPPAEIFRICEITLGAHEAAEYGRIIKIA